MSRGLVFTEVWNSWSYELGATPGELLIYMNSAVKRGQRLMAYGTKSINNVHGYVSKDKLSNFSFSNLSTVSSLLSPRQLKCPVTLPKHDS